MKIAVISDIHANLEALEAVLAVAEREGAEAVYCLGDIVGYGPDPAACIDLVRRSCALTVRGNHDEAVADGADLDVLPPEGKAAALHNRALLSEGDLEYLRTLPLLGEAYNCTFAHASPLRPHNWERVEDYHNVREQFGAFWTSVCFVGHSHTPLVLADRLGVHRVRKGHRYLINPGSVGQPRDGNPAASFGLYDTAEMHYEGVRVPYNVERAAARIMETQLPLRLAERLMAGL